jgi:hypothetical protein
VSALRILVAIVAILLLVGIAAAATRPGPAAFDAMLADAIRARIANTDIGANEDDAIGTIALAACKLRPTDCIEIVRQTLDVTFDEGLFVTRATVRGLSREASCIGAFTRFFCRGDVTG